MSQRFIRRIQFYIKLLLHGPEGKEVNHVFLGKDKRIIGHIRRMFLWQSLIFKPT